MGHLSIKLFGMLSVLAFALSSCKETPTNPSDDTGLIPSSEFDAFSVSLTGINEVTLTHSLGDTIESKEIQQILLGYVGPGGFEALDTAEIVSTADDGRKRFNFHQVMKLDAKLISPTVAVRYILLDSTSTDFSRVVDLYRYPYAKTNLVTIMDRSAFIRGPQDIAWWGDSLYMHTLGQVGWFSWHPTSGWHKLVDGYSSSDLIAADSGFLFMEFTDVVRRYDIVHGGIQDLFQIPGNSFIYGMDTYQGHLYVMKAEYLRKYSYSGELLDSTQFHWRGFYMTIANGIIMVNDYYSGLFRRYDLASLMELDSYPAPLCTGIKYHADSLYYCDADKYAIFSVALSDMSVSN